MQIVRLTNRDIEFYITLGPYLARRGIEKDVGYKIYDDDNKEWFVAFVDDELAGFCYLQAIGKAGYQIGSCYVRGKYRDKGVIKRLLAEAITGLTGTVQITTKSKTLQKVITDMGFVTVGQRGSFTRYGKEL